MGRMVVVYGGGFQPFHTGHLSSYLQAKKAFPNADFYVAASADVSKRPIPFNEKRFLATQAGVSPEDFRDVVVKSPLNPAEILSHYDPEQDVFVLVRSERDPVPYTKKDGSPGYFQPYIKGGKLAPFGQHGYVFVTKKKDFTLLGQEVYSGTQVRNLYNQANDQQRQIMIKEMYPKSKQQGTIKRILDKYLSEAPAMNEDIVNFIKKAKPLLKEASLEQKVRMLKLMKEALKQKPDEQEELDEISFFKMGGQKPVAKPAAGPVDDYRKYFAQPEPTPAPPKVYQGWEEYAEKMLANLQPNMQVIYGGKVVGKTTGEHQGDKVIFMTADGKTMAAPIHKIQLRNTSPAMAEGKSKVIDKTAKDLVNPPKVMQHRAKRDQEREEQYKNAQRKKVDESQDYLDEK